jgi:predicted RNase H-like HicB family nuclease
MITDYIRKKLSIAKYKILENGTYFGEIPGCRGVWASSTNLESCREELQEVLEDWIVLKLKNNEKIPGWSSNLIKKRQPRYA